MFGTNRYALFAPEGEPGTGAAGGDHGSDQDDKSKDVVPKSQFLAALSSAERKHAGELQALRAEMDAKLAAATAPKVEPPKVYTRAELNALVADGKISQDQADEQIDLQISARAEAKAVQAARETVHRETRTGTVETQLSEYKALVPELLDRGSEAFDKVKAEFQYLLNLGDPNNLTTELKAIRAVHGPIEQLKAAKAGKPSHESHRETGGEGGGGVGPKGGGLKLSEREKAHYQRLIDNGQYKDWKEVEAEQKFARPDVRRRNGAPA